jgi:hypothetical protein
MMEVNSQCNQPMHKRAIESGNVDSKHSSVLGITVLLIYSLSAYFEILKVRQ